MKIIEEIEGFFSAKLGVLKGISTLIQLETKLAWASIVPLLINIGMLFIVFLTSWVALMSLLGYIVSHVFNSVIYGISSTLLLNFIISMVLLKYLQFNLKSMSFEKTRAYFGEKPIKDEGMMQIRQSEKQV